jgi:hypothetical protein
MVVFKRGKAVFALDAGVSMAVASPVVEVGGFDNIERHDDKRRTTIIKVICLMDFINRKFLSKDNWLLMTKAARLVYMFAAQRIALQGLERAWIRLERSINPKRE